MMKKNNKPPEIDINIEELNLFAKKIAQTVKIHVIGFADSALFTRKSSYFCHQIVQKGVDKGR